jgi:hypothetical protein
MIRERYSCVSVCMWDARLDSRMHRGYMLPTPRNPSRSPDHPDLYVCVLSTDQNKPWQDLVWTKELLGILDDPSHWTTNKQLLGHTLDNRESTNPHEPGTPLNVMADKNGVALALGCAVPGAYRAKLRAEDCLSKYSSEDLEEILCVPAEFFVWLFGPQFETDFERALKECDQKETLSG